MVCLFPGRLPLVCRRSHSARYGPDGVQRHRRSGPGVQGAAQKRWKRRSLVRGMDPHGRRGGSESPAGPGLESRFDGIRLFFPREHVLPDGGALSPAQGPEGARYLRQGRFLFSGSGPLHRRALYRTGRDPLRKRKVTSGPFRQTVRGGQKALSDGRLFDGLDVTKEICFFFGGVRDLVRRGIACLLVDGPGNGESIRFRPGPPSITWKQEATSIRSGSASWP